MEQQKQLPGKEGEVAERSRAELSGAGSSLCGAVRLQRSDGLLENKPFFWREPREPALDLELIFLFLVEGMNLGNTSNPLTVRVSSDL